MIVLKMGDNSVEGEWRDFQFKKVTKSDYAVVMQHLKDYFCKGAPLASRIGCTEEYENNVCNYVTSGLEKDNGLSFMAVHKPSQKLAGLGIAYKVEKDAETTPLNLTSEPYANAIHNLDDLARSANLFEKYGVNYYADLFIGSVDPQYRGMGLATEMGRRSLRLLRSKGYTLACSNFTNPISRKAAEKFGFTEVARRYFKDFIDLNGERFIHNAGDDECSALMVIQL